MSRVLNSCQYSQINKIFTFKGISLSLVSSSLKHDGSPADKRHFSFHDRGRRDQAVFSTVITCLGCGPWGLRVALAT